MAEQVAVVEDIPLFAVREGGRVCLSLGSDERFGSSCTEDSAEGMVSLLGTASGMRTKGIIAGRVPSTVTHVRIEQDGEHVADAEVRGTAVGRFFAVEVPGEGIYRVVPELADGDAFGAADVEVRKDGTATVQMHP